LTSSVHRVDRGQDISASSSNQTGNATGRKLTAVREHIEYLLIERTTVTRSESFKLCGHSPECDDQLHEIRLTSDHWLISHAKRQLARAMRRHALSPASIASNAGNPRPCVAHRKSEARQPRRADKRPQRAPVARKYAMHRALVAARSIRALERRRA
jgi:hypothetical protein